VSNDERGHSAYQTWLIYSFRAIEKVLPNLKGKPKHAWVAPAFLALLVLLSALGVGIYVDGDIIHPPVQYTGLCSPPGVIRGGNCIIITVEVVTTAGTVTTVTQTQQAGTILNLTRGGP
jgi:hypothetical protein